jgi:hypothetical protein
MSATPIVPFEAVGVHPTVAHALERVPPRDTHPITAVRTAREATL